MNQTAVEFLYEALWEAGKDKFIWQIILQQAKEMEKEQIQDAYKFPNTLVDMSSEEYYNETYGKK
jgi:CRISPR/Cas system Type II protein with McrA/HNH and RuvC-like nuclease domain